MRVSVDTGCDSDTQVSVETDCEDWRRRYVDSVTDCMRQIEDLARKHHLPLSSFPVYGQLELMKGDLLWNAYTQTTQNPLNENPLNLDPLIKGKTL